MTPDKTSNSYKINVFLDTCREKHHKVYTKKLDQTNWVTTKIIQKFKPFL